MNREAAHTTHQILQGPYPRSLDPKTKRNKLVMFYKPTSLWYYVIEARIDSDMGVDLGLAKLMV